MLPVVHETGGPPSSRRRRRATAVPLVVAALTVFGRAKINARNTGAGRISRLTSTATMMTMALTVLLVLVPAAFPEKIPIEMTASLFCSYANEVKPGNAHPLAVSWYTVEDTGVRCLCEGRQGHLPLKQTRRSPNAINSTVLPDKGDRTVCP
ncbi:hypothetical protein ALC57_06091 [Trachymyrmex cornetzi]|uniref:Uncharacterized protein n=1 Tax=Trachymyrmex cornetzi TaxID=471704 RepID=A0A195E8E4_9HYME|nr:hypothetical protein ALC57_06091 [Trachymyrmex cornetzi]